MDNITHSLAGILVAEAVCAARGKTSAAPHFRTTALLVSVLANNLPDFDFVYRGVTPGKLGYLLHHRGHTHTVVGAVALAFLAAGVGLAWSRVRSVRFGASEWRTLCALAVVGTLLHVAMDFQNNYGVHPFWPFDDRWYYGDTLFIVEPLLWTVAIPVIALLAETRVAAVAVTALLLAGLVLGVALRRIAVTELVGLSVVAGSVAFVARALSRPARIAVGIGGWVAVTLVFAVAGGSVERLVRASAVARFPTTHIVDIVRTPSPGNPLCWSIIAIGTDGPRYVARRGVVSLAPGLLAPQRCASTDSRAATAPLSAIEATDGGVLWRSEFSASTAELRALFTERCDAAAFLRYARAPFWLEGERLVMGDLRFDRSRALEFAELPLGASAVCPPNVPPWQPPRADVLAPVD